MEGIGRGKRGMGKEMRRAGTGGEEMRWDPTFVKKKIVATSDRLG